MSIGRICVSEVTLATPQDSVQRAALRMSEHKVGTLLILNDTHQPIGVLTDRDIVTRVVALGKDPAKTLVGDVMTSHPVTVSEDSPVETALAMMRSGGFRRMPVVRDGEHLVGVVSLDDVLSMLAGEFSKIGELITPTSRQSR